MCQNEHSSTSMIHEVWPCSSNLKLEVQIQNRQSNSILNNFDSDDLTLKMPQFNKFGMR